MRLLAIVLLAATAQDSYLPLREGARWTYEVEDRTPGAAEPQKDVTAFVGQAREDAWVEVAHFLGYAKALLRTTETSVEFRLEESADAPTLTLLRLPAKARDTWTGTLGGEELAFTVAGDEMLEIGGRREKAIHVTFGVAKPDLHAGHPATKGDLWFASGRGLVRAQVTSDLDCHSASMKVYTLKP